jgi:hypothetical protein
VIKEVDTSLMTKEEAMDQFNEIALLASLSSSYVCGYYDSFIDEARISIILEYCALGDLCSYMKN